MASSITSRLLSMEEAEALCVRAAAARGASRETALALARSTVAAEAEGMPNVGVAHFIDYLEALKAGRIRGDATPDISRPAPAIILSDAKGGAAHTGFDRAFGDIVETARRFGLSLFSQRGAYTCGALGYFAGRLADEGLVAFAATNGPALMAGSGGRSPVFCTNPMAFAAPQAGGPPLLIDQASSAAAFVSIRKAAAEGRPLPEGWALDAEGNPTTDAKAALDGALVAFGGARGANIALMVEVLAAGLSGANWSLDAPPFNRGNESPGTGLFVLAIAPSLFAPDFEERMKAQLERLAVDHGVHIPGLGKGGAHARARKAGIRVAESVLAAIEAFC
jgi:(2R)-3-sulfolactate dehydrogenase (NADP+)